MKYRRVFRLEVIFNTSLGLIGFLSLFLLLNDFWILYFIPIDTKDLNPLGHVNAAKGQVVRKMITDSLKLPLFKDAQIFEDDLVITGNQSSAELTLGDGQIIVTEPNSICRIRHQDGKEIIDLSQGSISAKFYSDRWLTIKTGLRNQQVLIRKGTYLIKNSGDTIQITTYSSQHTIRKGLTEKKNSEKTAPKAQINADDSLTALTETENEIEPNKEEATTEAAEIEKEKQQELEQAKAAEEALKEEIRLGAPLHLPQPSNDLVFLLQRDQSIKLIARPTCEENCILQVFRDKKIVLEKTFLKGQVPMVDLYLEEGTNSSFEWKYTDEGQTEKFQFRVMPFSTTTLKTLIDQDENIEIL